VKRLLFWFIVCFPSIIWVSLAFHEATWWVENIAAYPSLFLLVYLLIACVFGVLRRWSHTFASVLFAVVFWLLTPAPSKLVSSQCANSVTVAQFNLFYENEDINQTLSYLHNSTFDLVVLQEVSPSVGERLKVLSDIYPYQYGGQEGVGFPSGQMILSRSELRNMSVFYSPDQQAIIRGVWRPTKQQAFVLITAHPPSPRSKALWHRRNTLIHTIETLIAQYPSDETIIIGDFNLSAVSLRFANLFPSFQTTPVASWPNWAERITTPPQSMIAIDHLWLKSAEQGRRICRRWGSDEPKGSDHKLVATVLGY